MDIDNKMVNVLGEIALSETMVCKLLFDFKRNRTSTEVDPSADAPKVQQLNAAPTLHKFLV